MAYIVRFDTRIEWVVTDEDEKKFIDCATPEMFIKYQEDLLKPSTYLGIQSLEDFVANAVIKQGAWSYETDDTVEDMGEWKLKEKQNEQSTKV
jgi:hypothetical protein